MNKISPSFSAMSDDTYALFQSMADRLEFLEKTSSGPSPSEVRSAAAKAVDENIQPIARAMKELSQKVDAALTRLSNIEKVKAPNIGKSVAAGIEPIVDEMFRIEESLSAKIDLKSSKAAAHSLEARNAATATVKAAEIAVISAAKSFAFGD